MRRGIRFGVDVGTTRVGVARSDPDGLLATPVETLARGTGTVRAFTDLTADDPVLEVVVGLPLSLRGGDTPSTADARRFAQELAATGRWPVRLVDERMSTVSAQRGLHAAGRSSKSSRAVIDQAAAVIILQNALDFERAAGRPAGVIVDPDEGS